MARYGVDHSIFKGLMVDNAMTNFLTTQIVYDIGFAKDNMVNYERMSLLH